jgi:ribosome biogenesis GTPase
MRCCNDPGADRLSGPATLERGLIVANYGRHFLVETSTGQRVICHSRGKKSQGVVGDKVLWQASRDEGTVETIEPRHNLFYRRDEIRTKSFAANLDRVLILVAAEPAFSSSQLSRALIAAEAEHITPLIALNKSDMVEPFARAWDWLLPYRQMNYTLLPLSLKTHAAADKIRLMDHLHGKTTLVLGKHTTTSTTLYWADADKSTALIDSPGFQEFGLQHIDPMHLAGYMPDLKLHATHCRFYNCTHLHEPGCAVIAAVSNDDGANAISADRYKIYGELFAELSRSRY